MRSDSLSRTLAIAMLSLAAAAFSTIGRVVDSVRRRVVDFVLGVPAAFAEPALRLPKPAAQLVQACAYALRIAKRERPVVRSTWRMCPSA